MDALLDKRFYIRYLTMCYGVMIASVPLLDIAIERSEGALRDYFKRHRAEEIGHDDLVVSDLRALGVKGDLPLVTHAISLAGTMYYRVRHDHPVHLLGYMGVLEGNPLSADKVSALVEKYGLEATQAIRLHSKHDLWHGEDIKEQISLLSPELAGKVVQSAEYTAFVHQVWQQQMLEELQGTVH